MVAPKGNRFAAGCEKSGRPLKYKSVDELQSLINNYFDSCYEEVWVNNAKQDKKTKEMVNEWTPMLDRFGNITKRQIRPFTITGLALALDTTRETLLDYEGKEEFSYTIKKAKEIIHNYTEEELMKRDKPTGVIFNLKNNYGWRDKSEVEMDGKVDSNINVVFGVQRPSKE